MKELLEQIVLTDLEIKISRRLQFPIKFERSIGTFNVGNDYLRIESNQLKDLTGILSGIYRSLKLTTTAANIAPDKSFYYLQIGFSWEYNEGGSNGHTLCNAWYDFMDKKWSVSFIYHLTHFKT